MACLLPLSTIRSDVSGEFGWSVAVEEGILPGQGIDETAEVPLLLSGEKSLQLSAFRER